MLDLYKSRLECLTLAIDVLGDGATVDEIMALAAKFCSFVVGDA